MNRQLRLLGLTAVAVVAFSAISVAQATAAANFHFESTPTYLKGVQETKNVLATKSGTVKCSVVEITSSPVIPLSIESVVFHPTYSGCTAFGQAASVSTTSCSYTLSVNENSASFGRIGTNCSVGTSIVVTVTAGGCTISVGAQAPSSFLVSYTSSGAGASREITVTFSVSVLTYTSSGGICGTAGTESVGTYSGTLKIAGFESAAFLVKHGIWTT